MEAMNQVEIRIRGEIAREWSDWLAGLRITYTERGETALTGPVRDQAALRGVLNKLADLGLDLVLVAVAGGRTCSSQSPPQVGSSRPVSGRITYPLREAGQQQRIEGGQHHEKE
jgi:hypothetical protein